MRPFPSVVAIVRCSGVDLHAVVEEFVHQRVGGSGTTAMPSSIHRSPARSISVKL